MLPEFNSTYIVISFKENETKTFYSHWPNWKHVTVLLPHTFFQVNRKSEQLVKAFDHTSHTSQDMHS